MHLRLVAAVGFGALLVGAFAVTQSSAQPNTIRKIAEGVWFREGDMRQGHCNNAIVEMKDYLIIVDANYPSGARLAMADAKKLSPKPVRYVFDTHHHGDHAYGNSVWTAEGATTLAYKAVVEEMNRFEPARWKEEAASRKDVAALNRDDVERPKQTFDTPSLVLEDGTRVVQFLHFGWAHTRGDAMLWLPKERVLCTGDAATNGPYNNTADADIGNWPKVIAQAQKLKPLYVLPGHGGAGGAEILDGQALFMTELRKAVGDSIAKGKSLGDIVTPKGDSPASTSIQLPVSVKAWVGGSLPAQVKDAYSEISSNKPVGELPHR